MNISPSTFLKYLHATLQMMLGKQSAENSFDISEDGLWQAIFASWIISSIVSIIPIQAIGWNFFPIFLVTSLVSLLSFVLLSYYFLERLKKGALFLKFMVPYLWLSSMQMIFFVSITIASTVTGILQFSLLSIPAIIWIVYWLIRISVQQLGVSRLIAFGFLAGKFIIETILGVTAGMSFSLT
ncbi:hypothetical protein N9P07_04025 [Alphaproteobacteria bacterium]|nr:hypothetical protein [Alphaproteobacteria bacterium]